MSLDILFPTFNRLEFTQIAWRYLIANTNWDRVDRLVVYDDGSEPRARLWIQDACVAFDQVPVDFRIRDQRWGSPVAIMADYLNSNPAEQFVKIDNDIAVCPGWLDALCAVGDRFTRVDLLGFEVGMTHSRTETQAQTFQPSSHIGGIGLMRSAAFKGRPLAAFGRYFGFTEWQHSHREIIRGWITPDLPCPLLDRLPFEPFPSLSRRYIEKGWQRRWGAYSFDGGMDWAYGWILREGACA